MRDFEEGFFVTWHKSPKYQESSNKGQQTKLLTKYCMLEFDETALTPGLSYNKMEDCIEGIKDSGDRRPKFADHVMVFMLRGIAAKWKQPVAHFFVKSTTGKVEIAKNVRHYKAGPRVWFESNWHCV